VWQVRGDGVGSLIQGLKPVHMAGHEIPDACGALAFETGHDVDEDESANLLRPCLKRGQDPGEPAHAGADDDHRRADLLEHRRDIGGQGVDGVLTGRCAVAVPVAAGIQGKDV
jgi:hypothetical protein